VIGVVILGATFFAVSFQAPPSPDQNPGTEQTEQATQSALRSLDDLYIDDASYNHSALSRGLARAAAGETDPLVSSIAAFLPSESSFCAYLHNGESRRELYCPNDPPGSAVGVSYPIEPNWRFHYAEPDLRYTDVESDSQLGLSEIPIYNAHSVRDEGEYASFEVEGTQSWSPGLALDTGDATYEETGYTTLLQGDDSADYPSASIYMQCDRDSASYEPCYASDLTEPVGMTGYGPYSDVASGGKLLRFTVENNGPGALVSNTELEIRFPTGLDVNQSIEGAAGFTNIRVEGPDDSSPETVIAELDGALSSGSEIDLDVEVNRTDDRYAYKQVDARLTEGAVSTSQMLLRVEKKASGTWTGGDTRVAMVSTPKPAGSIDGGGNDPTGRWAVVVPIPYGETTVDNLTFEMEDDENVLRSVQFPSDFNPEANDVTTHAPTKESAAKFVWDPVAGANRAGAYEFVEFQFEIETNGTQTQASERFPFAQPEADFEGYDPHPQSVQVDPGIWWREYPPNEGGSSCDPDCPGYKNDFSVTASDNTASGDIEAKLGWRGIPLESTGEYSVADLTDVERKGQKSAMQAADVTTTPRRLAPGDKAAVDLDVEDLATYVADTSAITDMRLQSEIYAPWGIPNREPTKTIDHGRVAGAFETPNDLLALHVNTDGVEDVVTASTDGNVYGLSGDTGDTIPGAVFGLPEASGGGSANPNRLHHGTDASGNDIVAVGTESSLSTFYTIDGNLNERWLGEKPDGAIETFQVHVGDDWTNDNVPEVLLSSRAKNASSTVDSAFNQSRLTVWEGADGDGDGESEMLDAWYANTTNSEYGTVVTGRSTQMDMGNVGPAGDKGLWVDTGRKVSTNVEYVAEQTQEAIGKGDALGAVNSVNSVAAGVQAAGLLGFDQDASEVLNLSGIRVERAETNNDVTGGNQHSGIAVGGTDGWVWGLNGSAATYPVGGWETAGLEKRTDVAMGNALDGYVVGQFPSSQESYLQSTQSSFGEKYTVWWDGKDVRVVDTVEGSYGSSDTALSWWAGTSGVILKSEDRLRTIETLGGADAAVSTTATLDGQDSTVSATTDSSTNLDLTTIDFTGVHAVDEDEAWFVGHGQAGESLADDGVIVQTTDGGDSYQSVEVSCSSISCELSDIDHDGKLMWAVGDNGTVLVRNATAMHTDVTVDGNASIDNRGRVSIPLNASQEVEVDNVTVTWDPATTLSYGEAATLADGGSGDRDLWNVTKGCGGLLADGYTEDENNCDDTWGYGHGNTLQVRDYVDSSDDLANRTLNGTGTLTVGRFMQTAVEGYWGPSDYEDSLNLPLTFEVNASFSDGSRDTYQVHINNSGGINTSEVSIANWTHPSDLPGDEAFTTPSCFGEAGSNCPDISSINVTNVGTPDDPEFAGVAAAENTTNGAELYRLAKGTQTWTEVTTPMYDSFETATINPSVPDRWVAGGGEGQVLVSYDGGEDWEPVPSPSEHVRDIDYTNPTVATLAGGSGTGELFALNGYAPVGIAETQDIYTPADHGGKSIEKIEMTDAPTTYANRNGETPTTIEVWDEHAEDWKTLYTASSGNTSHTFPAPTDQVKLRFKLEIEDLDKFSPMLVGDLTLDAWSDGGDRRGDRLEEDADISLSFDLKDESKFADGLDSFEYDADEGYLRLLSVRNPWMHKLGNPDDGDWVDARNGSVGARVADMEVADNGTIWVLTEGIYDEGEETDASPVQKTECSNDASDSNPGQALADCLDNSLYAINATTGEREDWWDPVRFGKVPNELEVGNTGAAVSVGNATQDPQFYWIEFSDPTLDRTNTYDQGLDPMQTQEMVLADAFDDHSGQDDPMVALEHTLEKDGKLVAYASKPMDEGWRGMPSLSNQFSFQYQVPDDALYGNRVVMTQVKWNMTDTFDTELVQSARLHDTFEVTPNGGEMPLVPTYTLEVVTWIEDWR